MSETHCPTSLAEHMRNIQLRNQYMEAFIPLRPSPRRCPIDQIASRFTHYLWMANSLRSEAGCPNLRRITVNRHRRRTYRRGRFLCRAEREEARGGTPCGGVVYTTPQIGSRAWLRGGPAKPVSFKDAWVQNAVRLSTAGKSHPPRHSHFLRPNRSRPSPSQWVTDMRLTA